ncbi:MAG: IclR family transcriptional regulator [Spirochaetaceae bacterium]|nr:MAG: IclR family transcriptional regulator [Spirochaetaceae bacterium]
MAIQILSSVKKALELLDHFTAERPELSLAEISREVDAHKSSVFRVLTTLQAAGFLEKDAQSGKYRLGLKILDLAGRVWGRYDIRQIAAPFMEELARETGEVIHLAVLEGSDIVYLEKKGQGQVLTVATRVGGRNPAYASSMGKVLLADLPVSELKAILGRGKLKKLTANTITEMSRLLEELGRIRQQGFALDNEETFPGIRCVGAPIRDAGGKVIAAVSVTVPAQRMSDERVRELWRLVTKSARMISERVGASKMEA